MTNSMNNIQTISKQGIKTAVLLAVIFLWTGKIVAAPTVDSIKYVEPNQASIIVYLSENVAYSGSFPAADAKWVVYHNGVAYASVATVTRGALDPLNIVRLRLPAAITFSEAHTGTSIRVRFLGGAGAVVGGSDDLVAFGPTQAINDLPMECEMFDPSKFDYSLSLSEICAPVQVIYSAAYYVQNHYINSENYNAGLVYLRTWWGDGASSPVYGAEVSPGKFETTFNHTYPYDPSVCFWQSYMIPGISGVGLCSGGGLRKNFTYENHSTDDEGDGVYALDIDTIRVCLGQDFSEIFNDNTYFNCNPQIEVDFSNDGERYVRFTYGTNFSGEPRIQDILVDGNPLAAPLQDGFVVYDSIRTTGIPAPIGWAASDAVSHAYSSGTDAVGQVFEIMLENWGPCNNIFDGAAPIVTYAYIKYVDGPIANPGPDDVICASDVFTTAGAFENTAASGFWDTMGDGAWTNATSAAGATYTPGPLDIAAEGVYLRLHADDGAAGCPEHVDSMFLEIDPLITNNTIADLGQSFCGSGNPSNIDGAAAAGGDGDPTDDYQWQLSTGSWGDIGGPNDNNEDYDPPAGLGTTTSYRRVINSGECSNTSNPVTVTIHPLATVTSDPASDDICGLGYSTGGSTSFTVGTTGAAHTTQWIRSEDGGTNWDTITATNNPNDGCVYGGFTTNILTITSVDFPMDENLYRAVLRTVAGGCETLSAPATLTVYPVPTISGANQPDDLTVCELETADFFVTGSIDASSSIDTYQWLKRPAGSWIPIDGSEGGGTFTDYNTDNLTITNPLESLDGYRLRVLITSVDGCDVRSDRADLSVNPLVDINDQPDPTRVCVGLNTSFTVGIDGTPAAAGYQWETDQGSGTWIDASGGIYLNDDTPTLNLTSVPIGNNGWEYRCIIESAGSCFITSDEVALTVNANPTGNINPGAPGDLCNGDFIDFDGQAALGSGTYTHEWSGDIGPLDDEFIETPRFTAPGIAGLTVYNMTYTVTDDEGCIGSDAVSVTVNPEVTVNVTQTLLEVCSGLTVGLNGNPAGGTGAIGSVWTGDFGPLNNRFIAAPTFTAPAVLIPTVYNLTYTATDTESCDAQESITITVNPNPTAGITRSGVLGELCFAETTTLDGNPAGGAGGYSHLWTGATGPLGGNTTAVAPDYDAPSTLIQETNNLIYTVTDLKGCVATDNIDIITNPEVKTALLSGDASVCSGDDANLVVDIVGGTGTYTVVLADLDPPLSTTELGYTSGDDILTLNHTAATNTYSITSVIDSKNCRASSETGSATIIVGSIPTAANLTGGTSICLGTTTPLQANITGGAPPYLVEFTVASGLADEVGYLSGTDIGIPLPLLPVGPNSFQILRVTDHCLASIMAPAVGPVEIIQVNNNPTISSNNIDPVICSDESTDIDVTTNVPGTIYSWTVSDGGGVTWTGVKQPTNDSLENGVDIETISQNLLHTMNAPVSVVYTITSKGPLPTSCTGSGDAETVIVEPLPTAGITNSTQAICDGDAMTNMVISSLKTHNGTPTFDMTVLATSGSLLSLSENLGTPLDPKTGENYPFTISGEIGNSSTAPVVVEYTVTPKLTGGCDDGLPEKAELTINPSPQVNDPANQVICVGDNSTLVSFATTNSGGTTTYNWTNDNTDIGLGLSGTGNIPAFITTNTTSAQISATIQVTPTYTNGVACSGNPQTFTIAVNPAPQVTDPSDQVICVGDNSTAVNFATTNTDGATTYAWTNTNTDIGLAAIGTGNIPAFLTSNTTSAQISASIEVTPTYTNGIACNANPQTFTIAVNPTSTVNVGVPTALPYTILNGATTDMTITGDVAGTTFTWIVLDPGDTNASDDGPIINGDKISQQLDNTTAAPVTITYRIYSLANGCPGDSIDFDVTIDPSVDITVDNVKPDICTGINTQIELSSSVTDATFFWSVVDLNGLGAFAVPSPGTGPNTFYPIQDNLVNNGFETDSVIYTITARGPAPLFTLSTPQVVKVYVYPKPTATPINHNDRICDGTATNIEMDSDVDDVTFNWNILLAGGSGATPGGPYIIGDSIEQPLQNNGNTPITITYQITPTGPAAGLCVGDMVQVPVIVDPTPWHTTNNLDPEFCSEENTDIVLGSTVANSDFVWSVTLPKGTGAGGGIGTNGDPIDEPLINITQSPVNIVYDITVNGPGITACPGNDTIILIQVDPLPNTTAITGVDTICEEYSPLFFETEQEIGSTFTWLLPATLGSRNFGGTGFESNALVITSASIPGPAYVTDSIRVFEENSYGCTNDTIYKPLTIIPFPDISTVAGEADPCANSTWTYSVPNTPGSTFQWFAPIGAGFETDPTLNTVDITFGLFGGQVRVIETTTGDCETIHTPLDITVHQLPITTLSTADNPICIGSNAEFTAGPSAGMSNYDFYVNYGLVQSDPVDFTYNTNTLVLDDTVTVIVTTPFGCERESAPIIMTVNPDPLVTLASDAAVLNTICAGDALTFTATSAGAVQYDFYHEGALKQTGPLLFWAAIPGSILDGDEVYVDVTNNSGCTTTSNIVTTTVNDLPVANIRDNAIDCPGTTFDLFVDVSTGPAPYDITIGNIAVPINGYNGTDAIQVTPAVSTTYTLTEVTDNNGCTSTLGANLTGAAVITLYDGAQILIQPTPAEVCELTDTSFTVTASGDNLIYQWYEATDFAGVYNPIGGNSPTLNIVAPTAASDSNYYMVNVTAECDDIYSDTVMLDIRVDAIAARDPIDVTICEGLPTGFGVDPGNTANPSYQWYERTIASGIWTALTDMSVYSGTKTDSLLISSVNSTMHNNEYYVKVTNDCGTSDDSEIGTLTVNNRPEVTDSPIDTIICEEQTALFVVDPGTTTNPEYTWQVDMRGGAGFEDITGDSVGIYTDHDQATLIVNVTSRFNQFRYRAIVSSLDCTPPATSNFATVTVNELPEIISPPVNEDICEDNSVVFSVNAGVTTGATYAWEVDKGSSFVPVVADSVHSSVNASTLILTSVPSTYDTWLYRVTIGGACAPDSISDPVLLTVYEKPEILADPVNDTVCENTPANFNITPGPTTVPVYRWQVNKSGSWNDIDMGDEGIVYDGIADFSLDVRDPDVSFNNYRYRVRVEGSCSPDVYSEYATLVIDQEPEVSTEPIAMAICEDDDVEFIVAAGATTEPTYLWEYSSNGGGLWTDVAGSLASFSGADSDNDTLSLTLVPSTYNTYLFRATIDGKCPAALPVRSAEVELTVNDRPEIFAQPRDTVQCEQDSVFFRVNPGVTTTPTYVWQYFNGATWLTVPPTIYEGVNSDTLWVNGVNSSINGTRYRVMVGGTCFPDSISEEVILIVNERPEIIGAPMTQTICEGDEVSFGITTGVTTVPSILWQYSDDNGSSWADALALGAFAGADTDIDTLDLTAVPSVYNNHQFRAIVSNACGPNDTSAVAILTVKNLPLIVSEVRDTTTCEGVKSAFGINAGVTSDPIYIWEVDNGVTGWNAVSGAQYAGIGTDSLYVTPNSSMNGYLYRVVLAGYCSPNDTSLVGTLTVNENTEITLQPVNTDICELGDTLFYASPGVTTNPTYQWYEDPNTGTFAPLLVDGGIYSGVQDSVLLLTGVPYTNDNYKYQVEISGDCGGVVPSYIVQLTVDKLPVIVVQPEDTTTCELSNVSFTVDVGDTELPILQWYEDDGFGPVAITNGGSYIGANSTTLQIFGVDSAMTGYEYYVEVSNACEPIPVPSDIKTLTVLSAPEIWVQPTDSTICEGLDATFSVVATGETLDYIWFVDDGSGADTIRNTGIYGGQGTSTLQLTGADRTYHFNRYYVKIIGTCTPPVQSGIGFLYVNNPPEIQVHPVNDTICEFSAASFTVNTTGASLEYQWYEDVGSGPVLIPDGGTYIGATFSTLNIFGVDRGFDGYQYSVIVSGTCLPDAPSGVADLIVKTAPLITAQPADTTVCHGISAKFGVVAEGSELEYQWKLSTGGAYNDISDGAEYSGTQTDSLTKLTTDFATENGYLYRVNVSGPCGSQLSNPAIMAINSLPDILTQPKSDSVCEGEGLYFEAFATGPDLVYQWMFSTDGTNFNPVPDAAPYDGVTTNKLTINTTVVATMHNNQYRLDVGSSCTAIPSNVVTLTVWENPTANITGDIGTFPVICGGDELLLNGTPAGGSGVYDTHIWTGDVLFVDPTSSATPTFHSNIKGMYNLIYTVTDSHGCIAIDNETIENYKPTAKFTSDASPACGDLTVTFDNESTADATGFLWVFGDGQTTSNSDPIPDVVHHYDNFDPTGLVAYYNVKLYANDVHGCLDSTQSIITVYPKVDPVITADPETGCQPLPVKLSAQEGAANYLWDFGDGLNENGSYIMDHVYINLGDAVETYSTILYTTSAYGCVASDTIDIVVDPVPKPQLTVADSEGSTKMEAIDGSGASFTFTNSTSDGPWTFEYNFGDGSANYTTNNYNDVVHNFDTTGTFTVSLYSNIGDCRDSAKTAVTVTPQPPVALFHSITEGCHPLEVQFFNTSTFASGYTWQFGDGSISTQENPIHTFYEPSEFTVKLLASGPGGSSQTQSIITVNATPQVFFNYAPDSVFVNDKPVRFFNLTSYATDYVWNFGDNDEYSNDVDDNNTSTAPDPTHIYMYEGWKDVLLIANNEDLCSDSLFIPLAIKVIPAGALRFPNIFRPGDSPGTGRTDDLTDPSAKNSVFFPGVNKQVTEYHLYIYNRWGQLLFESENINIGWNGFINDSKAAQGVYIWKVTGVYSNGSPFSDAGDVTLVWQ